MKVLITGGAGFIGSHIADRCLAAGNRVIILDNLSTGARENVPTGATLYECDVGCYDSIAPHFVGVECVFHCAALARIQPSISDPLNAHHANATGTLNVLHAARVAGISRLIYSSTSSIYGDQDVSPLRESLDPRPGSPYAASKLAGEIYCRTFSRLYGLSTVILRYFNVYGPRQIEEGDYATVVGIFLHQRRLGLSMTMVEDGCEKRRDYTHVSDVVEANLLAMEASIPNGEIINIGCGVNFSVQEVAMMIGGPIAIIPKKQGEYMLTLADVSKAKRLLGWKPRISFCDGVAELKRLAGLA